MVRRSYIINIGQQYFPNLDILQFFKGKIIGVVTLREKKHIRAKREHHPVLSWEYHLNG
jgi:hypothetical protein